MGDLTESSAHLLSRMDKLSQETQVNGSRGPCRPGVKLSRLHLYRALVREKNNAGLFPRPVAVQPVIARQGAKITQIAFVYLYARGCDRPPTPRSLVNGNYGYLSPLSFYFYILYIKKRFATAVKCTGSPLSPVLVHCSFESSFGVRGITMIKKKRSRRKRKSRRRDCVDDGADIYAARWGLPIVYCLDKAFSLLGVRQKPDT